MAEIPTRLREQLRRWSAVQIDIVFVGEHQLYQSERIRGGRFLPHQQLPRAELLQNVIVDRAGSYYAALWSDHLETFFCDVVAILSDCGHNFRTLDAWRHIPIGTEYHVLHLPFEYRSLMAISLAHDHVHSKSDCAVLAVSSQAKLGNVDHDWWLRELERYPAPALQRQTQLFHAKAQRRI